MTAIDNVIITLLEKLKEFPHITVVRRQEKSDKSKFSLKLTDSLNSVSCHLQAVTVLKDEREVQEPLYLLVSVRQLDISTKIESLEYRFWARDDRLMDQIVRVVEVNK